METEFDGQLNMSNLVEIGFLKYGCLHYRRRCKIRAPCCNEIFDCRHCHNEAKNALAINPLDRHDIPRHEITKVICSLCGTEQDIQQNCINCGVCMGKYFCAKCKLFDDDVAKDQFHCDECGLCRTGGKENYFHCKDCGCCIAMGYKEGHQCAERALLNNCPVCCEFLFNTMKKLTVFPCGHVTHSECMIEMKKHKWYSCPFCSKSICNMTEVWRRLDREIAATPMPEIYRNKLVWILCNDCGENSHVQFHFVAQKCLNCQSYNTRLLQESESETAEMEWIPCNGCETEEWLLLFTSLVIEGLSAVFEQLNNALLGMVMAFTGLLICIVEIVYKARIEQVTMEWRGRLPWFYSHYPTHKLFGNSNQYFGLIAAIWQCFHSSLGYFYACKNLQNPIRMSITMFLFCLCLIVSKIIDRYSTENLHREMTLETILCK